VATSRLYCASTASPARARNPDEPAIEVDCLRRIRLGERIGRDDRRTAVYAAFALARLDRAASAEQRREIRRAITGRCERAVGQNRAALAHLLRQLASA
jgi:hypothetical protein